MKKYVKPIMNSEVFVANEYFSACGDSGTTYYFKCDASGWFGSGGVVYEDTNGNKKFDRKEDKIRSLYVPCSETHIAESTDDFSYGFLVSMGSVINPKPVII